MGTPLVQMASSSVFRDMDEPDIISVVTEARRTGPGVAQQINHRHHELEFNLIIAGKGTYFLPDHHFDMLPGTLVWLLPGQWHRLLRSPDFDMWAATIHPDRLGNEILQQVARRPCRSLSGEDAIALDRLLSHICQDSDEPQLYDAGLEYVFRSAWHITMTGAAPAERPMHPAVIRCLRILRSSADTPSAEQLARECGVAQRYLGQLLIEHTGRGFVEWRNRARLERFHLLYPKSENLLTACLEAGFGSYTQFHRVFSELVGTTPGDWARNGAQVRSVAMPPPTPAGISGSDAGSIRMAWYPLAELSMPSAARWFDDGFATNLLSDGDGVQEMAMKDPPVISVTALKRFQPQIIEEVQAIDTAQAERLTRISARNDIFAQYDGTFGLYGHDETDLAGIAGVYLAFAHMAAHRLSIPNAFRVWGLCARVRHALQQSAAFNEASTEELRRGTAALVFQSMILRHSVVGALASGSNRVSERIAEAAQTTALATLKIDVKHPSFVV